jgi:enoyl-CoA hydratase/carnithine racemase
METLQVEHDGHSRVTIWLDRPHKRNALNEVMLSELAATAAALRADRDVRVVVLRSTSGVFSAGADLNEWVALSPARAMELSLLGGRAFQALADLPVPVIAVLEGAALGGGLELALACDIRIGTLACQMGFPEPRLGNIPAWGGVPRLLQVVGPAFARELLLTGDVIGAREAYRMGLLNRLFSEAELADGLEHLVGSVLACEPATLALLKAQLSGGTVEQAQQEAVTAAYSATQEESRRRKEAFLARRMARHNERSQTETGNL